MVKPHSARSRASPSPMASMNSQCMVACSQLAVMNTYQLTSAERSSGGSGGITWSNDQPASCETGTISNPLARKASMMRGQRGYRMRPVTAGIVQQHDLAARLRVGVGHAVHDPLHDQIGGRPLPIVGIDSEPDRHVAERLRDFDRLDLVRRGRLRIAEERGSEQPHRPPRQRFDQPLRGVELDARALGRRLGELGCVKV